MTVRRRTLLIVGSAMLVLLVGQYAGLRYAFVRALTQLESELIKQQVNQATGEVRKEISNIDAVAADYAAWDKTYAYVVRPNAEFAQSDLADEALRRLRLDAVVIVNAAGREVLFRSLLTGPDAASLRAALLEQLKSGTPLVSFSSANASHQGLLNLDGRAIAIAIRPVLTSEGAGTGRGALLMARRLDDNEIRRIGETIHLSVVLHPFDGMPPAEPEPIRIEVPSDNRIVGEMAVNDIRDVPRWILRVDAERPLHRQAERWFVYFILTFLVSVAGVAAMTLTLLDRIVLKRLSKMSRTVTRIAQTGDLTQQVSAGGNDELSAVGSAIDFMLDRIRESRAAAERSATEAARLKSEFLANMSHEIRTPLNGVLGTLGILEDTPLNPDQQDLVRTTLGCAEGLLGLLNDVLDLSKIEAGKLTFLSEPVDLRATAEDVMSLFGPLIGSKPLDLLLRVHADVPAHVTGDHGRVRQVLVNLVGNAVKFTEAGHVLVEISMDPSPIGDQVVLRVSDSGVGIAPDKLTAIFESFTQADAATTRRFGGSGLGLTITRKLLTLMGGDISVTSELGRGSTFKAHMPLPEAPGVPRQPAWTGRVLLVDTPGLRRTVHGDALRDLGAQVDEADDLEAASAGAAPPTATTTSPPVLVAIDPPTTADADAAFAELSHRYRPLIVVVRNRSAVLPQHAATALVVVQPVGRDQWRRALGLPTAAPASASAVRFAGRVLLAEDNRVNQMVAIGLLQKLGCSVDTASNGVEAVQLAAAGRYDLILMDCEMPELDGFQATARIRGELRDGRVPIVALTAHATSEARARCLEAGMNDFVTKPFRLEDLQAVLARHLAAAAPHDRSVVG